VAAELLGYLASWAGKIWGFFLDKVMSRIIGQKLPIQLQDAVRNIIGKFNWTIFDISDFDLDIIGERMYRIEPAVSRMIDSALLGFQVSSK
jgi:hypothetical protein